MQTVKENATVYVQGHKMIAKNVRVAMINNEWIVRFNGECADADDSLKGTTYDGAQYGGNREAYSF